MFKVTGVSRCKDVFKVRFANDMSRVKILVKTGHDNIELIEMPTATDKAGCVAFLKTTELYNRAEFKEAIDLADNKYNSTITEKLAPVKKSKVAKPAELSLDLIKARANKPKIESTVTEPEVAG